MGQVLKAKCSGGEVGATDIALEFRHPTGGRRHQGRLPGGGGGYAAAAPYTGEVKRALQAERRRVWSLDRQRHECD